MGGRPPALPVPPVPAPLDEPQQHYEIDSKFFRLMLGSSFTYSAAFWADGDDDHADLAKAQERKLDVFAGQVGAQPATHIVDVGCGWGSAFLDVCARLFDEGYFNDYRIALTKIR